LDVHLDKPVTEAVTHFRKAFNFLQKELSPIFCE
jgi:hypothetical protein